MDLYPALLLVLAVVVVAVIYHERHQADEDLAAERARRAMFTSPITNHESPFTARRPS